MRVLSPLLFLTLVVSSTVSHSAPTATTTLETSPYEGSDDAELGSIKPEHYAKRVNYYLNASLAYQSGNYLERDQWTQGPALVLRFAAVKNSPFPLWDYEISLNNEKFASLGVGRRWYFAEEDIFAPYARLSGNAYFETAESLTGLIEIRRWRAHAGVGAGERFTAEFGTGFSVTGPDLYALLGYNFLF